MEVLAQGTDTVEVKLDAGTAELIRQVDRVEIRTEVASFQITANTFGTEAEGKDISLSAQKVDYSALSESARANVPSGSVIVNLEARVGDSRVQSFHEPIRVSIPYTGSVQNGDRADALTVFLLKEDGSIEAVGGVYDAAAGMVTFLTGHFSQYFVKESFKSFSDMAGIAWAKTAVEAMAGKGIISGRGEDSFDPDAGITRAEFSALVTRLLKLEAAPASSLPFKDVEKGSWYYDAVAAAHQKGLINGKSADSFDPSGLITRQEMGSVLGRVLLKEHFAAGNETQLAKFSDSGEIAAWAKANAAVAVREGVISGMEGSRFAPGENATRAQAAVMLHRLYKLVLR